MILSQLAGNALAKVVPGGGAAGGALQYRMLVESGIPSATTASGLTAANLLTFATLLALPVLTVPGFLAGLPVDRGLVRAALLGAGCSWRLQELAAFCSQATERSPRSGGSRRTPETSFCAAARGSWDYRAGL